MNIQNIYSKFDEFQSFIDTVNASNPISAICLNECWIGENSDISSLKLPNYNMFIKRGNRKGHGHCGLVIYVHDQFKATELTINQESTMWDYLCVEISHHSKASKKYILCDLYRLPGGNVDEFRLFSDEFSSFLTSMKQLKHATFVTGDFNIDLLKIDTNAHFNSYFDRIIAKGFFPRITLPTRLSATSNYTTNTLIDNIFTNNIEENSKSNSGILINEISDHKMISRFKKYTYTMKRLKNMWRLKRKMTCPYKNLSMN